MINIRLPPHMDAKFVFTGQRPVAIVCDPIAIVPQPSLNHSCVCGRNEYAMHVARSILSLPDIIPTGSHHMATSHYAYTQSDHTRLVVRPNHSTVRMLY